ncbi:MAG: 50S ribosomal protein L10 [Chloroflexi bacterium]|jgi:large subunit ribosomal protein L10|nr:50S ribosomal protein L10 [Chloroflexota bacterium]MBT7080547.1 50S ribosomal protein L10 [Chloroflexota bacterium]MBT7289651.1 50S ribosomal protein L10 [Chloroflexota bacterium]
MAKEEKVEQVDQITEILKECSVIVAADYRGLTVDEMNALRKQLTSKQVKLRVVKNTLARFAADKAGMEELKPLLIGPTALAFGFGDDIADPAKVLLEYQKATKLDLGIKGGFLEDKMLSKAEITALSKLPSKEVLIATLLGTLQRPIASMLSIMNGPVQALTRVLQGRAQQLEGDSN